MNSNLTLHELCVQIGRTINAYAHEMKLFSNDKEIDERLNGHVIHTLNLAKSDIVIEKKVTIDKISLLEPEGGLNQKAKNVLSGIFK